MGEGTRKRALMEPPSGQRRPVWTASSPKTSPKLVWKGWLIYPPCPMAAPALALHRLETPDMNGVSMDEIIAAGERLPGMAALWDVATVEERREMVTDLLELGGLYYDVELKLIAGIKPCPAFLPVLRMLQGIEAQHDLPHVLVTSTWAEKRRIENSPTTVSHLQQLGSDGGTDGSRFLSHQRSPSSWLHMASCIWGFKNVCQRAKPFASQLLPIQRRWHLQSK